MKIFVSYASEDQEWAEKLYRELIGAGFEVWLDALRLFPGDNWYLETGKALHNADAMIVLLSPAAAESDSVGRDVQYALGSERFRDRVIPVLLQPSDKIPWILRHLKWSQGTPAEVAGQISDRLPRGAEGYLYPWHRPSRLARECRFPLSCFSPTPI